MQGKATWLALFSPPKLFEQHKTFIMLTAVAHTKEDLGTWYGLVESKIRTLISSIEKQPAIGTVHINPRSYPVAAVPERSCGYDSAQVLPRVFGLVVAKAGLPECRWNNRVYGKEAENRPRSCLGIR